MKKRGKITAAIAAAIFLIIVIVAVAVFSCGREQADEEETTRSTLQPSVYSGDDALAGDDGGSDDGSDDKAAEDETVVMSEEFADETPMLDEFGDIIADGLVVPSATSLNANYISGYQATTSDISNSNEQIAIRSVGMYTGVFIEDGSDEVVSNVAALLVVNLSDEMLQIAIIEFEVAEGETATFQVTNLPSGCATLVMEQNAREYSSDDDYSFAEVSTGFITQELYSDIFSISGEDGTLYLTNNSDETYDVVYVYYKYVQTGGLYLGGITYRTPFEDVEPGETVEALAAHYFINSSLLTLVSIE